jgi:hypothetical protein
LHHKEMSNVKNYIFIFLFNNIDVVILTNP